jgi:3-oxoacyl-[acyl-carrier-protein] synthase II
MGCGPRLTLSAACASGLHALIRAAMSLAGGESQRALVVAVEAAVHPLFLASFQRLGVLAPQGHGCRPFDQNRRGFLMSEAAAAVCLQPAEQAAASPLPRLDCFAIGGDATHLTATDPDAQTLRRLLQQVIDGRRVDLVHAHGTGTLLNDPAELSAIESAVATTGSCPLVYSHKAALGHSQGAAGLVSVVVNCLCHRDAAVPPNVNTTHPLPTRAVRISQSAQRTPIRRSLAIASGFGGPVAVLALESA